MTDKNKSRFPPESFAYQKRERLYCFANFYGESVSDAQGVVIRAASANKCQDCPDAEICFRLYLLHQIELMAENQHKILAKLMFLENRLL